MFESIEKQSASAQIIATIRQAVIDGKLAVGSLLDSERKLAEQFHVNRSTVREALRWLAAEGVLEIKQGGQTKVLDLLSASSRLLPFFLMRDGKLDRDALFDLLELRELFLVWIAGRAAERATDRDHVALDAVVSQMSEGLDWFECQKIDLAFYEALVAASKNRLVMFLGAPMRFDYVQHRHHFRPMFEGKTFDRDRYARLRDAIKNGDAKTAEALMRAHCVAAQKSFVETGFTAEKKA